MIKKILLMVLTSLLIGFTAFAEDEHQVKIKGKAPIYKVIDGKMKKVGHLPKNTHIVVKTDPHIKGKQEYKAKVNYHMTECGHLISSRYLLKVAQ
ncbi:hypothetical protein MY04_2156 [Flammeovirga sp. MY04]|uniref:hypothetical protein n=1 Tax=Flammeovirga sp. MY04 TaxID=1191459 RepID=UPI00080623A8|nr:hypothetical protein [Flammeovirga sp. MY04]ANQ49530.1 hypothetical protein MY04_2156 [Flammeovirga sp. MY04]